MATSTLIQFLAPGEASDTSHRRQVETFIARRHDRCPGCGGLGHHQDWC
jgi:hypothetical protein